MDCVLRREVECVLRREVECVLMWEVECVLRRKTECVLRREVSVYLGGRWCIHVHHHPSLELSMHLTCMHRLQSQR